MKAKSYQREEQIDMSAATDKPTRKPRPKPPVSVLVEREFVGDKTVTEAMIPVIFEDLLPFVQRGREREQGQMRPKVSKNQ
jgi:hypothetical protein